MHDLKREIFWEKLGGHRSFLWNHCYSYFGLPMTSALGFKARVDTSLSHFSAYIQRIPQIHLWGITPDDLLTTSIAAEPSLFHILLQALVGLELGIECAARYSTYNLFGVPSEVF